MTAAVYTCTRDQAEEITGRFRDAIGRVESSWHVLVATAIDAYQHRVWTPLGYENWDAYCASEVDTAAVRIPRDLRIEIVGQMSEAGMSTRAIGAAVGAHKDTVRNDLMSRTGGDFSPPAEVETHDPEPDIDAEPISDAEHARQAAEFESEIRQPVTPPAVTGLDGKSYKKQQRQQELPDGAPGPKALASQQIRVLRGLGDRCRGFADGGALSDITEITNALEIEEAAQLADDLSKGIRALTRIKRLLQELASTQEES